MKHKFLILALFIATISFSQTSTDVYVYKLSKANGVFAITSGKNISNNPGYDSQPHFYSRKSIVYASNQNGQTEIAKYDIASGKTSYVSNTTQGSEYSPQRIPNSKNISAVRLDKSGLQRFYKYDLKTKTSKLILTKLKVAYPFWYAKNLAINVVIVGNELHLIQSELRSISHTTIDKNVGRSVHRIPNTNLVSYVRKSASKWEIRSLDPKTKKTTFIVNSMEKKEDVCWLPDGTLLLAKGSSLFKFNPKTDTTWSLFHTFSENQHKNISRIVVNKKGNLIALVSE